MTAPLAVYGAALRRAASGADAPVHMMDAGGEPRGRFDPSQWVGGLVPGDRSLLVRCAGATLDVGCGPGRLTVALAETGSEAVGVDVSPEAVRQARRRGATVVCGSVFDPLPGEGTWDNILLADGNIGIGGDPERLLRRCGRLLASDGAVLAEVRPPGERGWRADVVLRDHGWQSSPFPWATVALDDVAELARRTAFRIRHVWTEAGRWFVHLGAA